MSSPYLALTHYDHVIGPATHRLTPGPRTSVSLWEP